MWNDFNQSSVKRIAKTFQKVEKGFFSCARTNMLLCEMVLSPRSGAAPIIMSPIFMLLMIVYCRKLNGKDNNAWNFFSSIGVFSHAMYGNLKRNYEETEQPKSAPFDDCSELDYCNLVFDDFWDLHLLPLLWTIMRISRIFWQAIEKYEKVQCLMCAMDQRKLWDQERAKPLKCLKWKIEWAVFFNHSVCESRSLWHFLCATSEAAFFRNSPSGRGKRKRRWYLGNTQRSRTQDRPHAFDVNKKVAFGVVLCVVVETRLPSRMGVLCPTIQYFA